VIRSTFGRVARGSERSRSDQLILPRWTLDLQPSILPRVGASWWLFHRLRFARPAGGPLMVSTLVKFEGPKSSRTFYIPDG